MRTQINARRIVTLAFLALALLSISLISTGAAAQEPTPPPEMTPTPILEPTPTVEGYFAQSSVPESSASPVLGRGIDPDGFTSEFFDLDNLIDPAFTTPYTSPIDFHIECFDEPYPWNSCKLDSDPNDDDELVDGREWSVRWTGILVVPFDGEYTFTLDDVDDGARLLIDGVEIVDAGWYWPGQDINPSPQTLSLVAGLHDITVDYEQRIYWVASLRAIWSGPGFTDEVIPLAAPMAEVHVLSEDGAQTMPWDGLVDDTLVIEAVLYEDPYPDTVTVQVTAEQSNKVSTITLAYDDTLPDDGHVYRGSQGADQLVNRPDELTVAAVVNAQIEFEYEVATTFMDDLGIPVHLRRGIAWGLGDEETERPPANTDFIKAAGYEIARLELLDYEALPNEFFIKNQAKMLLYIGEGLHHEKVIFLEDSSTDNRFNEIDAAGINGAWVDVETVLLFGCAVLDINNVNGWNMYAGQPDNTSPGKDWVNLVPGPQKWLGFQWNAPEVGVPPQDGEEAIYKLAEEIVDGKPWIDAWHSATTEPFYEVKRFTGAAAIDLDECVYHYYSEWLIFTSWEELPCAEWNSSSLGLEILAASPIDVHILDYAGRHTGPIAGGGYDIGIPGSSFWTTELLGEGSDQGDRVSILTADISQIDTIIIEGTDEGTFDFFLKVPDRSTGTLYEVAYVDVPVFTGKLFILSLVPEAGFELLGLPGGTVAPTMVSTRSFDLPVNLSLSGLLNEYGQYYVSEVIATISASSRTDIPAISSLEYDLGAGWQTYQEPLTITTNGEHILRYRGIFEDGSYDVIQMSIFEIYRTNYPPIADAGPDQGLEEGSIVTLSAASSIDPDEDPITFVWELISNTGPEVVLSSTTDIAPTFLAPDNGVYTFRVTVTDSTGATDDDDTVVTVSNRAPFVENITAPLVPMLIDATMTASAEFTDAGIVDDHSATWIWGDGSTSPGTVVEGDGQGFVTDDHTYSESGVYTIQLTVTDKDGAFGTSVFQYLVVYDPEGEFVTGGGWIDSPAGAYAPDSSFVGKAKFGFNAKYKNGATIPGGQTQFGLQGIDFNFHSAEYEWLVFSGDQAQYQGTGTVNGEDGYGFLVSVTDGDVDGGDGLDRCRVKIWDLISGVIVYDSQMGDPDNAAPTVLLGGGAVTFH